jgi:hypothetical protein
LKSRGWLVLAALGVCLAAVGFRIGTAVTEYVYVPTESVQVRYGDTLWSIAEARVAAVGGDVREMVQLIRQANHLESSLLLPGEVLEVPLQVD